jgi:hypothetical protein
VAVLFFATALAATGCARPAVRVDPASPALPPVRTMNAAGLFFRYPGTWINFSTEQAGGVEGPQGPGDRRAVEAAPDAPLLRTVIGVDDLNLASVEIRAVSAPTPLDAWNEAIRRSEATITTNNGRFLARRQPVKAAGITGLGWGFRVQTPVGYVQEGTLVVLVSGDRQYSLLCRFTSNLAAQIKRGCQQILDSLTVG